MPSKSLITPDQWQALKQGEISAVRVGGSSRVNQPDASKVVLPGAFNPLHEAHLQMAQIAAESLGSSAAFELSIRNVDKPSLNFAEVNRRAAQFSADELLWVTNTESFLEKSGIFLGALFVVGADTISRVGDLRYYAGQRERQRAELDQIAARGCRFLVFARRIENQLTTLDDLELPEELKRLCDSVPLDRFRSDISSTQLRRGER